MSELSKSQNVRLLDVFVLGPVLIYAATQKKQSELLRLSVGVIGVATILYNWRNYQAIKNAANQ